jgi:hypothetical protein
MKIRGEGCVYLDLRHLYRGHEKYFVAGRKVRVCCWLCLCITFFRFTRFYFFYFNASTTTNTHTHTHHCKHSVFVTTKQVSSLPKLIIMSNHETATPLDDPLWDEENLLLPAEWAPLYVQNAQAEVERLCSARPIDTPRVQTALALIRRYEAMVQHYEPAATEAQTPAVQAQSHSVQSASGNDINSESPLPPPPAQQLPSVGTGGEHPPFNADGLPLCLEHARNPRATYHKPEDCRELKRKLRKAQGEEERRLAAEARRAGRSPVSIMPSILDSTIGYYHQARPALHLAHDEDQAISWLNNARRRLREVRAEEPQSQRAVQDAEAVVLDCIRIVAGGFWDLKAVPSSRPPIVDQEARPTNLERMHNAMPHVAPINAGVNTMHNSRMPPRNMGQYYCPWHGRYVNHDAASCADGLFFESINVSLAQFQGLGLQAPARARPRRAQQSRDPRGHGSNLPPREYQTGAPPRRQEARSRSPRRRQDERSRSPRRRQDERVRSPRRRRSRSPSRGSFRDQSRHSRRHDDFSFRGASRNDNRELQQYAPPNHGAARSVQPRAQPQSAAPVPQQQGGDSGENGSSGGGRRRCRRGRGAGAGDR